MLVSLFLLVPRTVLAQDNCQDPDTNNDQCAVDVEKGESAPFKGQLLTLDLAADLGRQIETLERENEIRKKFDLEQREELVRHHKQRELILKDGANAREKIILDRLDEEEKKPSFTLGLSLGVAGTAIIVTVAVLVLNSLK